MFKELHYVECRQMLKDTSLGENSSQLPIPSACPEDPIKEPILHYRNRRGIPSVRTIYDHFLLYDCQKSITSMAYSIISN